MILTDFNKNLDRYLSRIKQNLATGIYTEHTHRPALKEFLEKVFPGIDAVNEPKRIECGAPDYIVLKGQIPLGYVESKDILDANQAGDGLDKVEVSDQLKRYRNSLPNLILTDFLEFRWYVGGERRLTARLAIPSKKGIVLDVQGANDLAALLGEFFESKVPTVGSSKDLAVRMAELSRLFTSAIMEAYKREDDSGDLHVQLKGFKEILIPDLTLQQFADMYGQTASYGLFAARVNNPKAPSFSRFDASHFLPKTNPFLKKMFAEIAGPNLDERISWIVDEIAELLRRSDMVGVLKDFGTLSGKDDPVVHFYETFLTTYNPEIRQRRGVYYTPTPVVSFIIRSVDNLLKTEFDKSDGISDSNVLILDPACGTGTFLYSAVDLIHSSFAGQEGIWNEYVSEKLLLRLFGFELLMAPYAIAHLKLSLQLQQSGYKFEGDERLGVYLTNSLEEGLKKSETLFSKWISEEANTAARIKNELPIMVVVGNPPYSKISANWGDWIVNLLEEYRMVDGKPLKEKKVWLQDDYVKFIRFGQWRIDKTGQGVLAFISNHGYLDNPTFRGMRQSLMRTFDSIYVLNLHGNEKRKETTPSGTKDENVFDITQGVTITVFVKASHAHTKQVRYFDVWGLRSVKYDYLNRESVDTVDWQEIKPESPYYFFVPKDFGLQKEYDNGWSVDEIFPENNVGFVTARDKFATDFDKSKLEDRLIDFSDLAKSDDFIGARYGLHNTSSWDLGVARKTLAKEDDWKSAIRLALYRPFDFRWIFYSKTVLERPVLQIQRHLLQKNLALLVHRPQSPTLEYTFVYCTDKIADQCSAGNKSVGAGISYVFPIYLYEKSNRKPNVGEAFLHDLKAHLKLSFVKDGDGDLISSVGPESIFYYAYAILHVPTYRERYSELLKISYPKIPITDSLEVFRTLVHKGRELAELHTLTASSLGRPITRFPVLGSNVVEPRYPKYDENTGRIYINEIQYFEGVQSDVWGYVVGGYEVSAKWLEDRRGGKLSYDEIITYQKILTAIKLSLGIMQDLDGVVQSWPISTSQRSSPQVTL